MDALLHRQFPVLVDHELRALQLPIARFIQVPPRRDLHDVVLSLMRMLGCELDLEIVRSRYGGSKAAFVRRQLIATLSQRGYSGVAISRYLRISTTCVAKVKGQMRRASLG